MKLSSIVTKILTNKWVLNIVAFLALLNVIGYIVMGNLNAVLFFILLGMLVKYFSKNMIIVLGVPLIIVNLFVSNGIMTEGMENKQTDKKSGTESNKETTPNVKKDDEQKKMIKKINDQASKRHGSLVATPLEHDKEETSDGDSSGTDGFEPGRRKNKGYDVDYATTIEDAYDELNKILGSDGIQRLTSDTQNLMKQQMQLAEAMKGMTPMIQGMAPMLEQAKSMMEGMSDGKNGLGGVMELAKKLSGNKQN